jgi:hypothetical protein
VTLIAPILEREPVPPNGFIFCRVIRRDPAVDALRSLPGFTALSERAAAKYRDACLAFADAGGQRLFGL